MKGGKIMEIKLNYCCKKLRAYLQGTYDVIFSIKNGYFYWENHDCDEDLVMNYCPFCGKKIDN